MSTVATVWDVAAGVNDLIAKDGVDADGTVRPVRPTPSAELYV